MAALSTLRTFWSNNTTLNTALPVSKVFLDYVPPKTAFPYARLTLLPARNVYTTAEGHIELLTYQLSVFHTDLDSLTATVTTVADELDRAQIDANTLTNARNNWLVTGEVVNGVYTYHYLLEFEWSYNSSVL